MTTEKIKQEVKVSFEEILKRCETIGDLQKLNENIKELNQEIGEIENERRN